MTSTIRIAFYARFRWMSMCRAIETVRMIAAAVAMHWKNSIQHAAKVALLSHKFIEAIEHMFS
jgi:hypothetical protein